MKNVVPFIFLLILLVSGCSQEEMSKHGTSSTSEGRVFTTSFEQNDSRTYVEDGHLSRWTEGDRISLFDASTLNCQYLFGGETGDAGGSFSMLSKPEGIGVSLNQNYAVYPYDEDMTISSEGVIMVTMPTKQHYAENSYGLGDNMMVAVTHNVYDTFLKFKNVGGCFKLQLYGDDITVKTITLAGNNSEKIAGKAIIIASFDKAPIVNMADDATTTITLDCGEEGMKIGSSVEDATAFWMVLPPVTFEKGITVTVTDVDGCVFTQTTSKELVVERNVVNPMVAVEVEIEDNTPYISLTSEEEQDYYVYRTGDMYEINLECSTDKKKWEKLTNLSSVSFEVGSTIYFRAKSPIGTDGVRFILDGLNPRAPIACTGDIRTLIDYENYDTVDTSQANFENLFAGMILTSVPLLPSMDLAPSCYERMFRGCTLSEVPKLPATTLAESCYKSMFENTTITQAPDLPATTLAKECYSNMFNGCENLKEAPALSANRMEEGCYYSMFSGCVNLAQVPELPATTLAQDCYERMFMNCEKITKASELPATTLAIGCYQDMFSGCTNLGQAPKILPATILTNFCYRSMFANCSNLTESPILPAPVLTPYCYEWMFEGCSMLTTVTILAVDTKAENCLYRWLYNVSSTGTLYKSPLVKSVSQVPSKWSQIDYKE